MREILDFFVRNSKWLVFVFWMTAGCFLLFTRNPYQQSVYLTSAGQVAGTVYDATGQVTSYFNLRSANEELNKRNAVLQGEVITLREQLQKMQEVSGTYPDSGAVFPALAHFGFITARVINNSVARPFNYITINKGTRDGVKPEMGVIDQNGVVGMVNVVSDGHARVLSLLNPHFRLSCKIKGNDSFGSLYWDGTSPRTAVLEELPRHTHVNVGDTVVTSGHSAVFPEGVPVGIVAGHKNDPHGNYYTLNVTLLGDFARLNNVQVVVNNNADEIRKLEEENARIEGKVSMP
ncbi:MAG: rod shape-determining protein MreC [Muribaculaceae bacterium]